MSLARSVRRALDDSPVSMQFDELAAVDGPQKSGAGQVFKRANSSTAKQCKSVPIEHCSSLDPLLLGEQKSLAVVDKYPPSVKWDVLGSAVVIEACNTIDPPCGNAAAAKIRG